MGRDKLIFRGLWVWVQGIFLIKFSCNNKLDKLGFVSFVTRGNEWNLPSLFVKKKNKTLGAYTHYFFLFCVFPIKLYLCYKFTPFSKNWNVLHESMPHLLKKTKIINMFFWLIPTGKLFLFGNGLLSTIKLTEEYFLLFYFKIRTIFYGGNFRSPETKLARNWHKNLYSCLRVFNMVSYFVYVQILAMYLNERKKNVFYSY